MAVEVVSRGQHGRVYVTDEREDGATVLLVCEAADGRLDREEETGIILVANEPPPRPDPQTGTYPLGFRDHLPLEMTIDTGGLQPGTHRFRMSRFSERVVEMARSGATKVEFTEQAARDFGLISAAVPMEG